MKNKNIMNYFTRKGLELLERRAEKKANAECVGIVYEPEVPKKLKKTALKGLVCMLTAASMLVGSMGVYKADDYTYRSWNTLKVSPTMGSSSTTVKLFNHDYQYEWAVTSCTIQTGYGKVTLSGVNCTVNIVSGNNELTQQGTRRFTRSNQNDDTYMNFLIEMDYDGYVTSFGGYVKIIQ